MCPACMYYFVALKCPICVFSRYEQVRNSFDFILKVILCQIGIVI